MVSKVMWLYLTSLLLFTTSAIAFKCPQECKCYIRVPGLPPGMIVYHCTMHVDFSAMNTDKTSGLVLDCLRSEKSELRDYIFGSLSSFVTVSIRNCYFTYIPRHAFTGMIRLKDLHINNARHLKFHPNAFADIPQLENLAIMNSGVEVLPNICELQNLTSLDLTANNIAQFHEVGLNCTNQPFQRLTRIDLSDNKLSNVPNFVLKSVPNLTQLSIANNKLNQSGYNRFGDFPHLLLLNLSGNSFTSFPLDMLANCSSLIVLGLAKNKVQNVPYLFFSSVSKLQILELDNTGVGTHIWIELNRLIQIRRLNLEYNNIQEFGVASPALKNLIELYLTGNTITNLSPNGLSNLISLRVLNLAKNHINMINRNDFSGLQNLTELDLSRNNIKYIHSFSFIRLNSLQILNISNNNIDQLPVLINLPQLRVFDARDNTIGNITESFCDGSGIVEINLMRNKIGHIGKHVFRHCYGLMFLYLSENEISTIDFWSFKDTMMTVFSLHDNKIRHIANLMTDMKYLKVVYLSNNEIEGQIYSNLFPSSIQVLDLSFNEISSIAYHTFTHMKDLRKVDLKWNQITTFNGNDISVSTRPVSPPAFYIQGNPLKCDCDLHRWKKMNELSRISPGMPLFNDLDTTFCYWTYQKASVLIREVPTQELLCAYREQCVYPCQCCDYQQCDCRQSCPESCECYHSQDWDSSHCVLCDNRELTNIPQTFPSKAIEVHFDGNNLTTVKSHIFIGMTCLKVLFLNHSRIITLQPHSFVGLRNLKILYLDHNHILKLQSDMFIELGNVSILHIEYNAISVLENNTFRYLTSLATLYLDHNRLNTLSGNVISVFVSFSSLTLSGNPWSCNCDHVVAFGNYLYGDVGNIMDMLHIMCMYNLTDTFSDRLVVSKHFSQQYKRCLNVTKSFNITVQEVKEEQNKKTVISLTVICVFIVLAVILTAVVAWHREILRIWIYTRFNIRLLSSSLNDNGRSYDAFVSYSNKDEHIVLNEIIPRLENGETRYRLCLHFRDFPIGAPIGDNIIDSIEASKRTIMLLSTNFLSSEWCQFEFQTAHHHVLKERSNRLIIVLLQDLDQVMLEKDPQLKLYIKTRTYLKFDDPWFWEKLMFAMPEMKDN